MLLQKRVLNARKRVFDRLRLRNYVHAIPFFFRHLSDPAKLAFNNREPPQELSFYYIIHICMIPPRGIGCQAPKNRKRATVFFERPLGGGDPEELVSSLRWNDNLMLSVFQQVRKLFLYFLKFGIDDDFTIGIAWVCCEIIVMIILRWIKHRKCGELCYDGGAEFAGSIYFLDKFPGNSFLLLCCIKNRGTILRANITPLPIHGCRVVATKKNREQIVVGCLLGGVSNFHCLYMSGLTAT